MENDVCKTNYQNRALLINKATSVLVLEREGEFDVKVFVNEHLTNHYICDRNFNFKAIRKIDINETLPYNDTFIYNTKNVYRITNETITICKMLGNARLFVNNEKITFINHKGIDVTFDIE